MRALFAALIVVLGVAGAWLGYEIYRQQESTSEEPYGVAFNLIDHNGQPITEDAFRGHPTAIFFGFTHCPEICPTTLYEMNGWFEALGDEGKNIKAYFITIDPERDTPEFLRDYITGVTDRVVGITGEPDAVRAMARGFNIYFKRIDTEDGDYTMDHTASVILLDSHGRFRKTIAYGEDTESAISKLRDLAGT
ncbi:SCO family protein [Oricola thermophila]|uniref:SCO family protein n=1 Tax=Oricola thermophila TaxID=2742145 RepID=A0A6N1V8H4_9HYPH|nr:SCO family protein [Oricola thermophila]QKV17220.1 SCO family protein [Oricola thermophila]